MTGRKRERNANFSDSELRIMLREVYKNKDALMVNDHTRQNIEAKREIWRGIAGKMSKLGVAKRDVEQIRKKWKDMKNQTLTAIANRKKGLGGECSLSPYEEIILQITGYDKKQIEQAQQAPEGRVMQVIGLTGRDTQGLGTKMEVEDAAFDDASSDDQIFAVVNDTDDGGEPSGSNAGNQEHASLADTDATDVEGDGTAENGEGGSAQKTRKRTKSNKLVIKHSDVLLAIKRKKLKLLEDRTQYERDRLAVEKERLRVENDRLVVEREILETLKELKNRSSVEHHNLI